ncbi:oligopeptide ABC transporter ATP-binding protein OppF [Mesoplasma corruscae]|uniref:Oligopeptide ABC transporter ATP-binding protein n=1 Tax=Mesoplasma corruscae TaxID=216874 RepID=A0A2S5RHN2_9MOLU|nr:oligopeptide ABC transporter ATP-binding protein OppF [Mesoplasma corruscae]PPE06844.1 oligopeptide ABC transporter ATP-binding protein [Mesoplasma corruscae]
MVKDDKEVLLNVRDLVIEFRNKGKKFQAVKGANFDIYKQEIFGLVGESGSGKTTIGRAIAGVQELADGSIYLDDILIAGKPTSLFELNKEIYKKIKFINTKYAINCNYINNIISKLKESYNKYSSNIQLTQKESWRKIFAYSYVALAHKLTKENLKFINEIIKDFKRINQFVKNINNYIPEVSKEVEESVLAKNIDTLDIVIKLKDKMSLDFHDLNIIKEKINKSRKNKTEESFGELMKFTFEKILLIKENDDRIKRRIKIAETLEEQNLHLSSPLKRKQNLIKKYEKKISIKNEDFIKEYEKVILRNEIRVSPKATKVFKTIKDWQMDNEKNKELISDIDVVIEYNSWLENESALTERQIYTIQKLIEYFKWPSIDELVSNSYLFKIPKPKQVRINRKNVQMIFQDPGSSLNERMSVEEIISEGLDNFKDLYKNEKSRQEYVDNFNEVNPETPITIDQIEKDDDVKKHIILKLVRSVGLLPEHLSRYPHEFSGGQKQRIGIARSLALKPKIIIADEPISALDVSIRAQVLNLFQLFKKEYNLTYLFVTHDLSVVKFIADRIAVIYHGDIVELAQAEELFKNPLHPYTRSLLSAIPQPDPSYNFDESLIVYDPKEEHYDYIFDTPEFVEISENHFVLANKRELKEIKKIIKK